VAGKLSPASCRAVELSSCRAVAGKLSPASCRRQAVELSSCRQQAVAGKLRAVELSPASCELSSWQAVELSPVELSSCRRSSCRAVAGKLSSCRRQAVASQVKYNTKFPLKGNVGTFKVPFYVASLTSCFRAPTVRHIYYCMHIQYFIKISLLTIIITFITLQSI
jgi:hypothetical protein